VAHPTKILGGPWPTRPTLQCPPCCQLVDNLLETSHCNEIWETTQQAQGGLLPAPTFRLLTDLLRGNWCGGFWLYTGRLATIKLRTQSPFRRLTATRRLDRPTYNVIYRRELQLYVVTTIGSVKTVKHKWCTFVAVYLRLKFINKISQLLQRRPILVRATYGIAAEPNRRLFAWRTAVRSAKNWGYKMSDWCFKYLRLYTVHW